MLDRTVAPEIKSLDSFQIQRAESLILENGIPLYTVKSGTQPVIRLDLVFKAGCIYESKAGVSYFTGKVLTEGTLSFSSAEFHEKIAYYGAFFEINPGPDRITLSLYSLSKFLNDLLPLIKQVVTNPLFDEKELATVKKITDQSIQVNNKKTNYLASTAFKELIFGQDHPYGRSLNSDQIREVSQTDVKDYFSDLFSSSNCEIIIAGNGDLDFFSTLNNHFGKNQWGTGKKQNPNLSFKPSSSKKIVVERPDNLQSSIRVGMPLFTISHPDYLPMNFTLELLGGFFGSRLMKNIREDKGFTYGIGAGFGGLEHSGYMVINTDVRKENTVATLTEIYKEIELLKSEPVKDSEIEVLVNYLKGSFIGSINNAFALADKFKFIHYNHLGYEFYDVYFNHLNHLNTRVINDCASKYFLAENFYEVVAGEKI